MRFARKAERTSCRKRKYSELLLDTLAKYRNRALEIGQVIEELIAMAQDFQEAEQGDRTQPG